MERIDKSDTEGHGGQTQRDTEQSLCFSVSLCVVSVSLCVPLIPFAPSVHYEFSAREQ